MLVCEGLTPSSGAADFLYLKYEILNLGLVVIFFLGSRRINQIIIIYIIIVINIIIIKFVLIDSLHLQSCQHNI